MKASYVGTLAGDDLVELPEGEQRLDAFDRHLQENHQHALEIGDNPIFRKLAIRDKGEKETS